ncbi:peptidase domain-containing ABC transporter [soil metagenome]
MSPVLPRLFGRRRPQVVLQHETAECGIACVAMVAGFHGFEVDLHALRRRCGVSLQGTSLLRLMDIAQGLALNARALRVEPADLGRLRLPTILHWNFDHFVVLERTRGSSVDIIDPRIGRRRISNEALAACFTGVALELTPGNNFTPGRDRTSLKLSAFFRDTLGLAPALLQMLVLSLALQFFALLAPFYSQLVIDDVIASGDRGLLGVLATGFALLVLVQVGIGAFRSWVVLYLSSLLRYSWAARLFRQLLSLPLDFFEKRHMGDVVSRFGSLQAVQALVTQTAVEAVIDGLMVTTTLIVMFLYDARLALIVAGAVAMYAFARFCFYGPHRRRAREAIVIEAREQSCFMESVRAIQAVKSFGREQQRESFWLNRLADSVNADVGVHKLEIGERLVQGLVFGLENVAVILIAALAILEGELTVGMLVAFLAYKAQFASRAGALIDKAVEWRLASIHLDRLADIVHAEPESALAAAPVFVSAIRGAIAVHDLCFRYAESEPLVLNGIELEVAAGECVALTAPSGFGKSTLLKLMLGLLTPSGGVVLVDGRDIHRSDVRGYRRQVACVMQQDQLLSGSLADNIAFFDPQPDEQLIESCARRACIHDDIARMPMGYHSLVGDMGTALSGGQKQRILIARALYRRPRILFLDEATSHLDAASEAHIADMLAELEITRIFIAHRRETLARADRVLRLHELQCEPGAATPVKRPAMRGGLEPAAPKEAGRAT